MFQFGTDDELPDGLAANLLGIKPSSMQDFGLAAALSQMPNSGIAIPARNNPIDRDSGNEDRSGSDAPGGNKPEAAPMADSAAGEWGKLLDQLYEAGKFKSG